MEYNQIETYSSENDVLERIKELKAQGISEDQIYVIADGSENASTITKNSNINYTDAEGSFADKLSSFFTGSDPEGKVLERFNMSEGQQDAYVTDLKEGRILLYTEAAQNTSNLTSEATGMGAGGTAGDTRSGAASDSVSGVANDSVDGKTKHVESGYMDSGKSDTTGATSTGRAGESTNTDTSVGENDLSSDNLARSQPNVNHEGGDVSEADLRAYDDAGARSQPNKDVEDELQDFGTGTSDRANTAMDEGTTTKDSSREMSYADEVYREEVVRDEDFTDDTVRTNDTNRTMDTTAMNNDFAAGTTGEGMATDRETNTSSDKEKMELHEEKLDVDKNRRQAGEVEINKETVHDKEEFDVPVTKEEVTVERRPVNEERSAGTSNQTEGVYEDEDSIRVPVHEEEVEVNKKDVVKEEIVVDKKEKKDNVHVEEEVRKEEADISDSTTDRHNTNERRDR